MRGRLWQKYWNENQISEGDNLRQNTMSPFLWGFRFSYHGHTPRCEAYFLRNQHAVMILYFRDLLLSNVQKSEGCGYGMMIETDVRWDEEIRRVGSVCDLWVFGTGSGVIHSRSIPVWRMLDRWQTDDFWFWTDGQTFHSIFSTQLAKILAVQFCALSALPSHRDNNKGGVAN